MNAANSMTPANDAAATSAAVRRRFVQLGASFLVQAAALFLAAGRLDWPAAWAYVAMYLGIVAVNAVTILPRSLGLVAERGRMEDTKGWDRALAVPLGLSGLATLVVAGLEVRFRWSRPLPSVMQFKGMILTVLGYGVVSSAMASNRFFSSLVRIQRDRGHVVATGGPYRIVRHPGYLGMITASLATPLLLGSRWALLPGGLTAALYVVRTVLEDRTLQQELDGYSEYARKVRYRLIPGLW